MTQVSSLLSDWILPRGWGSISVPYGFRSITSTQMEANQVLLKRMAKVMNLSFILSSPVFWVCAVPNDTSWRLQRANPSLFTPPGRPRPGLRLRGWGKSGLRTVSLPHWGGGVWSALGIMAFETSVYLFDLRFCPSSCCPSAVPLICWHGLICAPSAWYTPSPFLTWRALPRAPPSRKPFWPPQPKAIPCLLGF